MKSSVAKMTSKIHVTDYTLPGLATPCWKWKGAHDPSGYARMKVAGRCVYVRREMLECSGIDLDEDAKVISLCRDIAAASILTTTSWAMRMRPACSGVGAVSAQATFGTPSASWRAGR